MSSWTTSGKARLNARQNRTFEKRAQQRARVMTANNGSGTTEPQRILRERCHPNSNYQAEAVRGTKRHRNGHVEIISGERAKAKYSPNNPIRRRGVVATARRIQHPHSLDQHRQWQPSQSPPPHRSEYPPHTISQQYHPHRSEYHYDHHHHHYPAHVSGEEHSRRHHSRRMDAPHMETHHFPEHAQYRAAPYFPPTADRQAMTYDYKTAQWVPCRHAPPPHRRHAYEPPPDPIKEAQVYPNAHDPVLNDYHHDPRGYPSRQNHPKPPFQDRQHPRHYRQRSTNDWENSRSKNDDEDDYLYYGDQSPANLETQATFEMPIQNENVLDDPHHSSRQPLYENMDCAAVPDQHHAYSNDTNWHHGPPKRPAEPAQVHYDHNHDRYQALAGPPQNDFPEVKYSKSEMEPWEAPTDHFQIERSNTWSPGHSTSSAAEPQSFTLRRTSSSRGRRILRYIPPRLPYSPPRVPEGGGGLARFQKKRRTMSPARLDSETKTAAEVDENAEASLSAGPRFFNNGVQINEDGTPFVAAPDASSTTE